jgi:hypothetical protein
VYGYSSLHDHFHDRNAAATLLNGGPRFRTTVDQARSLKIVSQHNHAVFITASHSSVSLCRITIKWDLLLVSWKCFVRTEAFAHLPAFHLACPGSFSANIRLDRSRSAKIESLSLHRPRFLETPLYTSMTMTRSDRFADRAELSVYH